MPIKLKNIDNIKKLIQNSHYLLVNRFQNDYFNHNLNPIILIYCATF
jgi:hypothetical protein